MYLAVDIGGSKVLLAVFNNDGKVTEEVKFPTPNDYGEFIAELKTQIAGLKEHDFLAAGVGVPGVLDRDKGVVVVLGNLPWHNELIQTDIERLAHCTAVIENDAKAAGLFEAIKVKENYKRVLYITIGTGIGIAVVVDGIIDISIGDSGGKDMMVEHGGKLQSWENFASGKAIVDRYGKKAKDITDPEAWKTIAHNLAVGILDLLALTSPDVVIIGGGVGAHYGKFGKLLVEDLKKFETLMLPIPPILQAQAPEEAVIYGCYELAKQSYENSN